MRLIGTEWMNADFTKAHLADMPPDFVLHRFTGPDTGDPHDHPFDCESLIIFGGYIELVFDRDTGRADLNIRRPGDVVQIKATTIHRITGLPDGVAITAYKPGPKVQEPGFWQWRDGKPWHRFWYETEFTPWVAS